MLEMADALAMDLVDKQLVTDQLSIMINYDKESLQRSEYQEYTGLVGYDYYGRVVPHPAQGTIKLGRLTSSSRLIRKAVDELFCRIVDHSLFVRRLNITAIRVINEEEALREKSTPVQLDLFTDYEAERKAIEQEETQLANERNLQKTVLAIKKKFGKNAILKGLDFAEGATARERNNQIGGHKA